MLVGKNKLIFSIIISILFSLTLVSALQNSCSFFDSSNNIYNYKEPDGTDRIYQDPNAKDSEHYNRGYIKGAAAFNNRTEYFVLYENGLIGKHYETGENNPPEYAIIDAYNSYATGIAEVPAEYGFGGTVAVSDNYMITFFTTDGEYKGYRYVNTYKVISTKPDFMSRGAGKISDIAFDKEKNRMIVLSMIMGGANASTNVMVSELLPNGDLNLLEEHLWSEPNWVPIKYLDMQEPYSDLLVEGYKFRSMKEDGDIWQYCEPVTNLNVLTAGSRLYPNYGMAGFAITNTYIRGFYQVYTQGGMVVYEKLKFYDYLEQGIHNHANITLISPEENATRIQDQDINFTYNINSTTQIQDCSLMISNQSLDSNNINNGTINYTQTMINGLEFTLSLPMGDYTWHINCIDINNKNYYSESRNLHVVSSSVELCNGIDDDGDGYTDEYDDPVLGSPRYEDEACVGYGECEIGIVECKSGGNEVDCSTNPEGSQDQSQPELCDGLDNDCDILTDEDFYYNDPVYGARYLDEACTGIGECGIGSVECFDTSTASCSTNPGGTDDESTTESCNSLDDDCDGFIDETCINLSCGWNLFTMIGDGIAAYNISLSKGWNLFGHSSIEPFNWSEALVSDGTETKSILEADDWLQSTIYYFDSENHIYRFTPGDDSHLRPSKGYWLYAVEDNLTLTLPDVEGCDSSFYWLDAELSDVSETKSVEDAQAAGWLQSTIYYYDDRYRFVPGDDDYIYSWKGYWLYSNRDLVLIQQ